MAHSMPKQIIKASNVIFKSPVKSLPHKSIHKKLFSPQKSLQSPVKAKYSINAKLAGHTTVVSATATSSPVVENMSPISMRSVGSENRSTPILNLSYVFNESSSCEESEGETEIIEDDIEMDTPTRQQVIINGLESLSRTPPVIGQGAFGVVIKALHKGSKVAVKVINKTKRRKLSIDLCVAGELNAINLKHPNIVQTFGVFGQNEKNLLILMEFAGPKSLQHVLDDMNEVINWERRLRFAIEIVDALQYCHASFMAHLDVKPANVVISSNDTCKLCDFGCSKLVDKVFGCCESTFPMDGTVAYKAPELLRGLRPTIKADIYSYGITLWQLITRKIPFFDNPPHAIVYKVVAFEARPHIADIPIADCVSKFYVNLFVNCWQTKQEQRPSCTANLQVLRNAYENLHTYL